MNQITPEKIAFDLLESAGIQINGNNPWDIQIHNPDVYTRILKQGSLGLGESYMDRWWDCSSLDQFFERVLSANLEGKIKLSKRLLFRLILAKFINFQTIKRSLKVGLKHYDLGNDLFKAMLDSRMNYTCGFWRNVNNLDDAQFNKLELSCQKLMLKPGMRLLDIGCGYGAMAKHAAEKYGVRVVGISISKEQLEYAKQNCAGLPVELHFQDYRNLNGKFDRIVSLGMFEHVGHLNYRHYMQIVSSCLEEGGLFLLNTIGSNVSMTTTDPWINKYIFPNSMLPSIEQIGRATEDLLIMENWDNFGTDYDKTLMAWNTNFEKSWHHLSNYYDDRFYRMWRYYLLASAGGFRARAMQLWQIVFSKGGFEGGYQEPHFINFANVIRNT